jgi:hypothetical protein
MLCCLVASSRFPFPLGVGGAGIGPRRSTSRLKPRAHEAFSDEKVMSLATTKGQLRKGYGYMRGATGTRCLLYGSRGLEVQVSIAFQHDHFKYF